MSRSKQLPPGPVDRSPRRRSGRVVVVDVALAAEADLDIDADQPASAAVGVGVADRDDLEQLGQPRRRLLALLAGSFQPDPHS